MKSLLKQHFPSHHFEDKHDLEIQQFNANDLIEFASVVAHEVLKNASNNFNTNTHCDMVIRKSILSETNIPKI